MTREQAIKVLNMVEAHGLADEAKRMAIKSLEKESILDKIRAEINTMSGDIETIADMLAIIDKYKAESEV